MSNEEKLTIRGLMMQLKYREVEFRMHDYHVIPGGKVIKYKRGTRDAEREMVYIFDHVGDFVECKCNIVYFVDSI